MWHFLIRQDALDTAHYQQLQQRATLTEVELFNEPYVNWYVFSVPKEEYTPFMEHLDRAGISYDLTTDRPTRDELLAGMQ